MQRSVHVASGPAHVIVQRAWPRHCMLLQTVGSHMMQPHLPAGLYLHGLCACLLQAGGGVGTSRLSQQHQSPAGTAAPKREPSPDSDFVIIV